MNARAQLMRKIGHYVYLGANGLLLATAVFVTWNFVSRAYAPPAAPPEPVTQEVFDKSLEWLEKKK